MPTTDTTTRYTYPATLAGGTLAAYVVTTSPSGAKHLDPVYMPNGGHTGMASMAYTWDAIAGLWLSRLTDEDRHSSTVSYSGRDIETTDRHGAVWRARLYTADMLTLWERPDSYAGATWYDYVPVAGQSRDSDTLEATNWQAWREILAPFEDHEIDEDEDASAVMVAHAGHWAVGWVETLLVHRLAPMAAHIAVLETLDRLDSYPVLDEDALTELEEDEIQTALNQWGYDEIAETVSATCHEWYAIDATDEDRMRFADMVWQCRQYGNGEEMYHDGHGPIIATEDIAFYVANNWQTEYGEMPPWEGTK